jgi:hypothetical protein
MKHLFRHYFSGKSQDIEAPCAKLPAHLGEILLNNFLKQTNRDVEKAEIEAACQFIEASLESLQGELDKVSDRELQYELISQSLKDIEAQLMEGYG